MKYYQLIIAGLFAMMTCQAQDFRVNAYAGYVFNDAVDAYVNSASYFNGTIRGSFRWGVEPEYKLDPAFGLGFLYLTQKTEIPLNYYDNGSQNKTFDARISWFMLSGNSYLTRERTEFYFGILAGLAISAIDDPSSGDQATATKPAWGLRTGAILFMTQSFGLKVQADLMSAVRAVGGSIYFGSDGSSNTRDSYTSSIQFGLGGGVVFRF